MASNDYERQLGGGLEKKGIIKAVCLGYSNRRMGNSITHSSRLQKGHEVCAASRVPSAADCVEKASTLIYSKIDFFFSKGTGSEHKSQKQYKRVRC